MMRSETCFVKNLVLSSLAQSRDESHLPVVGKFNRAPMT